MIRVRETNPVPLLHTATMSTTGEDRAKKTIRVGSRKSEVRVSLRQALSTPLLLFICLRITCRIGGRPPCTRYATSKKGPVQIRWCVGGANENETHDARLIVMVHDQSTPTHFSLIVAMKPYDGCRIMRLGFIRRSLSRWVATMPC